MTSDAAIVHQNRTESRLGNLTALYGHWATKGMKGPSPTYSWRDAWELSDGSKGHQRREKGWLIPGSAAKGASRLDSYR